jgi:hypothetical protein
MRWMALAMGVAACVPPADQTPSYYPQPAQQQPYGQAQPADPYPQPQSAPPQQSRPSVAAANSLHCGELLGACSQCPAGGDCVLRCVQERGTPRAQWDYSAIAGCAHVQGCTTAACVEQGCSAQMAACRADQSTPSDPMAPVPFVGEWSSGGVSLVGFYSPATGFTPGTSTGDSYRFDPGGEYEHGAMLQTQMSTCSMAVFEWTKGHYTVQGDQLTLVETEHRHREGTTCNHTGSASKEPPEKHTYKIRLFPSEFTGAPRLSLYENGQEVSRELEHR